MLGIKQGYIAVFRNPGPKVVFTIDIFGGYRGNRNRGFPEHGGISSEPVHRYNIYIHAPTYLPTSRLPDTQRLYAGDACAR